MRRAAKRDASEAAIVAALRTAGWSVEFLNLTDGPDLLIGKPGRCLLIECKTGKGKLKPGQSDWHQRWKGPTVIVVRTVEEAIRL
jgi:Holliday junction resolvase